MKKILTLFTLLVIVFGCAGSKSGIEREDIVGVWKEVQRKQAKSVPEKNISNCNDDLPKGLIYTFNADGTYTQKAICPDDEADETGTWEYRDNVINLITEESNTKFSVSPVEKNKLKISALLFNKGSVILDMQYTGYYSILEKQ